MHGFVGGFISGLECGTIWLLQQAICLDSFLTTVVVRLVQSVRQLDVCLCVFVR